MLTRYCGGILLISMWLWGNTVAEIFQECGEREGLYISSELGCSYYIFCYGEDSFMEQCDEDNPYFSEVDQTCDTEPGVCKEEEAGQSSSSATTVSEELSSSSAVNSTTTNINSMQNSTIGPSTAATTTTTIALTTFVNTTTPLFTPVSTLATHLAAQCPLSDDPKEIVFLRDTKSCANYFMCYHGEPVAMQCSNMLHFDQKSQKCDYPENVKCQLDSFSVHEKCQTNIVDVFSHPTNCNYYYLCRYGYLLVMQCPWNMGWDYEKRACIRRDKAKCYAATVKISKWKK